MNEVRVGLLGCGTVGTGVLHILSQNAEDIRARLGVPIRVVGIAVKNTQRDRDAVVPMELLCDSGHELVNRSDVDVVVETIGGLEPARSLVLAALAAGKHVVTANKALLATHGPELFTAADDAKRDLVFEASVGGGIPIIRMLREGLASDKLRSIHGIINGTSNFILSAMTKEGRAYDEVLLEAQQKGFAEADPTMDVGGADAAQKLSILLALGFGAEIAYTDILTEGIDTVDARDIAYAEHFGYRIKSLAIGRELDGQIEARVHPTLIRKDALMAAVDGVFNAVLTDSHAMGTSLFYGKGAGMLPTAMSVVSDIIEVGRNLSSDTTGRLPHLAFHRELREEATLRDHGDVECPHYLRFVVRDQPGVVAGIATLLGKHGINISQMLQPHAAEGQQVDLVIMTHCAKESHVESALFAIHELSFVLGATQRIRIEPTL